MKYNKIMLFFGIAVIFSTVIRFFQINYTIEFETGFFKTGYETIGYFILVAIFVVSLLTATFSKITHKKPEHPPQQNLPLGIVAFLPAIGIGYEVFLSNSSVFTGSVQTLLLKISGAFAVLFFIYFGVSQIISLKLNPLSTIIPCIYVILKIICDFTSISSLALISDNIFLIGGYCLILLFMLNLTKLYNNINEDTGFRRLLASGTAASVLCISQSIPYLIINLFNDNTYNHISSSANFSILAIGLFITAFILVHFSDKNID